ncbi:MAG: Tll0287-like domain-containing protein [Guyparkeria sp.]|uniref:Tll0287-like domain-containing protein n=1 Tax=Guyparkeria sp. TaxID=2035736 RepID=UPI00397E0738
MKASLFGASLSALALAFAAPMAQAGSAVDEQLNDYRQAAQSFGKTLKGELQAAMKSGGPTAAVEVCHERAPEIAADLSEETGFTLRRTSLKPRATKPTSWETAVLLDFEQQRAKGTAPADIEWHEVVEADGDKELRYMKAIGTDDVCLSCHGENVDPDLLAKIEKLYPEDQATGFKKGDIRGAFSIHAPLDD